MKFRIIAVFITIWSLILVALVTAEPILSIFENFFSHVSAIIPVDFPSALATVGISAYATTIYLLVKDKRARLALSRFLEGLKLSFRGLGLKSEISFYDSSFNAESADRIRKQLNEIRASVRNLREHNFPEQTLSDADISELKNRVAEKLQNDLPEEIKAELKNAQKADLIAAMWNESLARLSGQTVVLGSRANLILWMGIAFCVAGLLALWISFFTGGNQNVLANQSTTWIDLVKNYGPRLSLVVLIQLIGFFFLKIYRSTLLEIRYIQNEITNVEMKSIALSFAEKETSTLEAVIINLVHTDRNFIIDKGQTTADIEKHRIDSQSEKSHMLAAAALLHGTDKASIWRRS